MNSNAKFGVTLFLIVAVLIAATSCQPTNTNSADLQTLTFKTQAEYESFIKNHENTYELYRGGIFANVDVMLAESKTVSDGTGSAPSTDYSETNNQVSGVDEADIIKTDGEYIYTISDNTLFIVKAYPGEEAEVVYQKTFNQSYPSNLFISGNKLAIMGTTTDYPSFEKIGILPTRGMSFLQIYDVSDKSSPSLDKEYKFEGNYYQARLKDEKIYLISTIYPRYREVYPLPIIMEDSVARELPIDKIHYLNIQYNNPVFININVVELEAYTLDSKSIAIESIETFYMSDKNMYFVSTEYINEWELIQDVTIDLVTPMLSTKDLEKIRKIEATDSDVLSDHEKKSKILELMYAYLESLNSKQKELLQEQVEQETDRRMKEYEHLEYTIINKVDLELNFVANGKVPGRILNQFSLDEHNDVLRVGTTLNPRWRFFTNTNEEQQSKNNVYTLDETLNLLGKLENIAPGERIYSTRFVEDRLYMVTFRQVDPFFVIDLSDPQNIENLGELKIPGFSTYLHPYDENTIIGLGRDATEEGRATGLKISLFDVTDVSSPQEVAKFVTDEKYAQTTAEYEHKAFLFSKDKNLLVIPAYNYDYTDQSKNYNGALVFEVNTNKIELKGLIDHSTSQENIYGKMAFWYSPGVERSLYINDLLYTKSPNLLRINKISDLSSIKNVTLEYEYTGAYPVY